LALSLLRDTAEAIVKHRIVAGIFLSALLVSMGTVPGDAGEVVEIRLYGRYFSEPATVRILVDVAPDAANRALRIEADSETLFRASELELGGADDRRLHTIVFKSLPAGTYTLRAEVWSSTSVRGTAVDNVYVTGSGLR
jgi:hypothetical protein